MAVFERLRHEREGELVIIIFDLLELNGTDLRCEAIETRKAKLASLVRGNLAALRSLEGCKCVGCPDVLG